MYIQFQTAKNFTFNSKQKSWQDFDSVRIHSSSKILSSLLAASAFHIICRLLKIHHKHNRTSPHIRSNGLRRSIHIHPPRVRPCISNNTKTLCLNSAIISTAIEGLISKLKRVFDNDIFFPFLLMFNYENNQRGLIRAMHAGRVLFLNFSLCCNNLEWRVRNLTRGM